MPDLPEILEQEDLTVASLFYQLLLEETTGAGPRSGERRRITNRRPHHHPEA